MLSSAHKFAHKHILIPDERVLSSGAVSFFGARAPCSSSAVASFIWSLIPRTARRYILFRYRIKFSAGLSAIRGTRQFSKFIRAGHAASSSMATDS